MTTRLTVKHSELGTPTETDFNDEVQMTYYDNFVQWSDGDQTFGVSTTVLEWFTIAPVEGS